jgi:putative Mg2+ transporter-C (MgtC) family protein
MSGSPAQSATLARIRLGMACGAGLPILAIVVTAGHFIVVGVFPAVERRLPRSRWAPSQLHIAYRGGQGVLREVLAVCTQQDFAVSRVQVGGDDDRAKRRKQSGPQQAKGHDKQWDDEGSSFEDAASEGTKGIVTLLVEVRGIRSIAKLAARIAEISGVVSVQAGDAYSPE